RLAPQRVLESHRLVLAVGAGHADQHRQPADPAQLLLLEDRPREEDLVRAEAVMLAHGLLDPVHVDPDRRRGAARESHSSSGGDAPLGDLELLLAHGSEPTLAVMASWTASNASLPRPGS